jgi:hypothetical protein
VSGLTPNPETRAALERSISGLIDEEVLFTLSALPNPTPPVDPVRDLVTFTEQNAIYFSEGIEPRQPGRAEAVLEELARLMSDAPDFVRVVMIGWSVSAYRRADWTRSDVRESGS